MGVEAGASDASAEAFFTNGCHVCRDALAPQTKPEQSNQNTISCFKASWLEPSHRSHRRARSHPHLTTLHQKSYSQFAFRDLNEDK